MNLNKSFEYFDPHKCNRRIHIIGCGAVGSTIAENLVRLGLTKITLYDFDVVEPHNIANQMFRSIDIGKNKAEALAEMLIDINPDVKEDLVLETEGYDKQPLSGYVFLAVDTIELRRKIIEDIRYNGYVEAVFDIRVSLEDAQSYAADWSVTKQKDFLFGTMQFSHDDAKAVTPVSACNLELSVAPTIRSICANCVANFMNYVNRRSLKNTIIVNAFNFMVASM